MVARRGSSRVDDRDLIECVERIRGHLSNENPHFGEKLRAAQPDLPPRDPERLKWRLAAIVLGLDDTLPEARRQIRRIIAAPSPCTAADEPAPLQAESDTSPRLPSAQRQRLKQSLASMDGFAAQLDACTTPEAAAALAKRHLPVLRGRLVQEFLVAVGVPVMPQNAPVQRLMLRLGWLTTRTPAAFRAAADRAARAAVLSHAELALLFGLFSGARRDPRHQPVCVARPRCESCPVTHCCLHFRLQGAHTPQPPSVFRRIRDWAEDDRPRERMRNGHHLSDADLLAIVLRTGTGRTSAVDLARMLLTRFPTLHHLDKATWGELESIKGIGPAKAAEIKAALEIGKRAASRETDPRAAPDAPFASSASVFERYRARFMGETQERFIALLLNTRNRLIREIEVSVGTLNASIVHPREAFRHAITEAAAAIIFLHNHPSGDPTPSAADREMTRRLVETGRIVGIQVLDHVIIGAHSHYSFADAGEIS
jgi:DNA repair protein RadC